MKPSGVSVVIPLHERCDPLGPLYKEYLEPLRAAGLDPEFLFVAAPSHAAQANEADVLRKSGEPVRVLRLAQPAGPAMLTRVGATEAKNDLLLVLPAYRRIEAQYLPGLVERVQQGADAAFAARVGRREPLPNRARRWLFHSLARPVTSNRFHDLGCGVAALRRDALLDTPIYGEGEASEQFKANLGKNVLFPNRLGRPDELASMAVELVTNSYMNAEVVRVDGGIRMPPK